MLGMLPSKNKNKKRLRETEFKLPGSGNRNDIHIMKEFKSYLIYYRSSNRYVLIHGYINFYWCTYGWVIIDVSYCDVYYNCGSEFTVCCLHVEVVQRIGQDLKI